MITRIATLTCLLGAFAAPAAHATDFDVSTSAQLTSALSTSDGNGTADRILLAPGTYTGPFQESSSENLEILGTGAQNTVLTASTGNLLGLFGAGTKHLADVTLAPTGSALTGLSMNSPGIVERVAVSEPAPFTGYGMILDGTGDAVAHVSVTGDVHNQGLDFQGSGTSSISDSTFSGSGYPVASDGPSNVLNATRLHITGPLVTGLSSEFGGHLNLSDSLIAMGSGSARALFVSDNGNSANFTGAVDARRVTIIGDGTSTQFGAVAGVDSASDNYSATLHDVVMLGVTYPMYCFASGGGTNGTVTADYSSLPAGSANSGCTPGVAQTHAVTNANLGFVAAAAGDYRLRFDSPLVDAGDPAVLAPTTDLGGLPRPVDGDGNGSAIRDVGAYEYQRSAPAVTAAATPATAPPGDPVAFTAVATDADPGETAMLTWAFDDGASATGASVSHTFGTPGSHSATVTATDPTGLQATAVVPVTVAAPGSGTPPPGGGTPPPSGGGGTPHDTTPPMLSRVGLKKAAIRWTLSEAARVTLGFERRRGRRYRAFRHSVTIGAQGGVSMHHVKLSGLAPGRYRIVLVARDAAGNRSAAVHKDFVVRRR